MDDDIEKSPRTPPTRWRVLMPFVLACLLAPPVISATVAYLLCLKECTALPWMTFAIAPVIFGLVLLAFGVMAHRRAGILEAQDRRFVRMAIYTAVLWIPLLLGALSAVLSLVAMTAGWLAGGFQ